MNFPLRNALLNCRLCFQKNTNLFISSDSDKIRTHNDLVSTKTLNHLAKLAKWLSCLVGTYLYCAFDCMLSSYHVQVLEWIHTKIQMTEFYHLDEPYALLFKLFHLEQIRDIQNNYLR